MAEIVGFKIELEGEEKVLQSQKEITDELKVQKKQLKIYIKIGVLK